MPVNQRQYMRLEYRVLQQSTVLECSKPTRYDCTLGLPSTVVNNDLYLTQCFEGCGHLACIERIGAVVTIRGTMECICVKSRY